MNSTRRHLLPLICAIAGALSTTTAIATCPAQMTIYTDTSQCVNHHTIYYIGWDEIPQVCGLFFRSISTHIEQARLAQTWNIHPPGPGSYYTGPITPYTCIYVPYTYKYRAWSQTTPDTVDPGGDHFWVSAQIVASDQYCNASD